MNNEDYEVLYNQKCEELEVLYAELCEYKLKNEQLVKEITNLDKKLIELRNFIIS